MLAVLLAAAAAMPTPAQLPTVPRLVQDAEPVFCAGARGRSFALTFDDGPSPYTPALVRVLRRAHARASFFDVGSRIGIWPDAARSSATVGEVANHTWSHAHLPGLSAPEARRELVEAQHAVARATGTAPRVFRPPYDESTPRIELLGRTLGLLDIRWSVDSGDSRPGASPRAVVRTVVRALRPGAIILLHDPHASTPSVAGAVLRTAARRGLAAVTVSELLARQPPSRRQRGSTGAGRCPP
ncbi:MAG: polysaccharide deacetylase family protein [Gaiellaceae bacterium]